MGRGFKARTSRAQEKRRGVIFGIKLNAVFPEKTLSQQKSCKKNARSSSLFATSAQLSRAVSPSFVWTRPELDAVRVWSQVTKAAQVMVLVVRYLSLEVAFESLRPGYRLEKEAHPRPVLSLH